MGRKLLPTAQYEWGRGRKIPTARTTTSASTEAVFFSHGKQEISGTNKYLDWDMPSGGYIMHR